MSHPPCCAAATGCPRMRGLRRQATRRRGARVRARSERQRQGGQPRSIDVSADTNQLCLLSSMLGGKKPAPAFAVPGLVKPLHLACRVWSRVTPGQASACSPCVLSFAQCCTMCSPSRSKGYARPWQMCMLRAAAGARPAGLPPQAASRCRAPFGESSVISIYNQDCKPAKAA